MLYISLNIILDKLSCYQHEVHVSMPCDKAFNRTALLPRDDQGMNPDWLYICRLSEYIRDASHSPGIYYICLRDRMIDTTETESMMANTIIINENMELEQLFTEVQDVFFQINEWIREMQETVIRSKSLQDLLELSERVIGNTINISDSALTLLAHTWNVETDDPVTLKLIENGFHPEETLQKFKDGKRFEAWDAAQGGLLINDQPNYSQYCTVGKIFKFHNNYYAHVVMVCDHQPLTQGLLDLFQIFMDILRFYIEREWENKGAGDHVYDSFFVDLLDGKLKSKNTLEERARHAGVPLSGPYQVLMVALNNQLQVPMGRMGQELGELLPEGWVLIYRQQLMVLNRVRHDQSDEDKINRDRRMCSFLERYDAVCGVSEEFVALKSMPSAYEKAHLALKYCDRFQGRELLGEAQYLTGRERIFVYDDNLIYYLLGENEKSLSIWQDSIYAQALHTLREYDRQHNTDNLRFLRTYLKCERRATETSQLLHMHRNNVIYRMSRIEELLGLDFDDPNVRLSLLVSYAMVELNGLEE